MRTTLLDIRDAGAVVPEMVDSVISFDRFTSFLERKIAGETSLRKEFYESVLQQFKAAKIPQGSFTAEQAPLYKNLLELVFATLTPALTDDQQSLWGLAMAAAPVIFYATDALGELMTDENTGKIKCNIVAAGTSDEVQKEKGNFVYSLIFDNFYPFNPFHTREEMVQAFPNPQTGLVKYYRVNVESSFIKVFAKGPVPELQPADLHEEGEETVNMEILRSKLPLSLFRFEGFAVLTLTDVTSNYAVEHIKNIIINRAAAEMDRCFSDVIHSLKTLVENPQIEFGLMPVLRVNDKLVFDGTLCSNSILVSNAGSGMGGQAYIALLEQYLQNPRSYFVRSVASAIKDEKKEHLQILKQQGIEAYALLPVYYNSRIAGVLEIYSREKNSISENTLEKLKTAVPLLAQLLQHSIDEFNSGINTIIRDKFTAMQPAVQWKFNEVAWHYLQGIQSGKKTPELEPVYFKNVYPIYGAIDIRNSTIERNKALRADFRNHFELLIQVLERLNNALRLNMIDQLIFKCKRWLNIVIDVLAEIDEQKIEEFLQHDVVPLLLHFKDTNPDVSPLITPYFDAVDEERGIAHINRRQLETSMQTINFAISNYLDLFKDELQQSYPCYYEKFRTDGIEYDIYIGQSIAPAKTFNYAYLKNIRLWQLTSMAAIAKMTRSLVDQIPKPLQTTQLIFIHANTIDISFRNDEKRFDVEGTYNIRYQVIKKRIDKVHVKSSGERLTQPDKIALVYFNRKEAKEYIEYIHYLQEKGILEPEIEELELEELQGVSGLKAIRVGVK